MIKVMIIKNAKYNGNNNCNDISFFLKDIFTYIFRCCDAEVL